MTLTAAEKKQTKDVAAEMRKLGYPCTAEQVRATLRFARAGDDEAANPMAHSAALAANILSALAAKHVRV